MISLVKLYNEITKPEIEIYRLESSTGLGPFRQENIDRLPTKELKKKYNGLIKLYSKKIPPVIVGVPNGYVFGTTDRTHFEKNLGHEGLEFFEGLGFKINKYKTNKYYKIGKDQIIFKK